MKRLFAGRAARRRAGLVGLALGALAASLTLPAAAGAASVSARPLPATWKFSGSPAVGWHLRLATGPQAERVAISYDSPQYSRRGEPIGGPLLDLEPRVSGAGRIDLVQGAPQGAFSEGTCFRGSLQRTAAIDLTLPASSVTVLRLRFRLHLPFPGTDLRLPVRVSSLDADRKVTGRTRLRLPAPRLAGKLGVPLRLASLRGGPGAYRSGRPLAFRGSALRRLRGRRIALRASGPWPTYEQALYRRSRVRTTARARVDRRGRFSGSWRPGRAGWYSVRAVYGGDRRFARDASCPLEVSIGR